jgi:hypothetical protein
MDQTEQKIKLAIFKASMYWREQLPDEVLSLYAKELIDLPCDQVIVAYHEAMRDPAIKRLPLPSEIRARISNAPNDKDHGKLIAANILTAIARFGSHRTSDAKEWLGPAAWETVKRQGGWESLCSYVTESNKGQVQAQLRDLAQVILEASRKGSLHQSIPLPTPSRGDQLTVSLGEIIKRALPSTHGPKAGS